MSVAVHAHAAALLVELLKAGMLEEAEAFALWCLEWLELDLSDTMEAYTDA